MREYTGILIRSDAPLSSLLHTLRAQLASVNPQQQTSENLEDLEQWLRDFGPDIVGIQETKLEDHKFPDSALITAGYRSVFAGQKTYNGVALLSREPAQDVQIGIPGFEDEQKRVIASSRPADLLCDEFRVIDELDLGLGQIRVSIEIGQSEFRRQLLPSSL